MIAAQSLRSVLNLPRLAIFLFLVACFLLLAPPALAQSQNPYAKPNTNSDVPQNIHTGVQVITIELFSALTCQLIGVDPTNPNQKCLGIDPQSGKIGFVENGGGAIGTLTHMIATLYTPPIHISDYLSYLGRNFGIAKPVYAATGFELLNPLLGVWSTSRNLVYLLFVLVFVVTGIAIMLRIKMDPRTVMTIQNQIPRLIVGLIMVTFSYAIAGVLIDLMYVVTYTVSAVILQSDPSQASKIATVNNNLYTPPIGFVNELYGDTPTSGNGILNIAGTASKSIYNIITRMLTAEKINTVSPGVLPIVQNCQNDIPTLCWFNNFPIGAAQFGAIMSNVVGWTIGATAGLLGFFVILIAVLFSLFRLWFTLLKAYVFFLVDVITGPFWILVGLLPGQQSGLTVTNWIRDIVANLAVFPAAIAMFTVGKIIIEKFDQAGPSGFVPPLIGNPNSTSNIGALLGIGLILLTPQVLNMIRDALKTPQFKYLSGAGQAIGQGFQPVAKSLGYGREQLTRKYNAQTREEEGGLRTLGRTILAGRGDQSSTRARFANRIFGPGSTAALQGTRQASGDTRTNPSPAPNTPPQPPIGGPEV